VSPRAAPLSADERRDAIIDVVVPLLLEHGRDVSTRQIAEAAGIAEGTIFRVFPDKAALWTATAERTLDRSQGPPTSGRRSYEPPTTCSNARNG
jgi:AcrR family transcriptional regulator